MSSEPIASPAQGNPVFPGTSVPPMPQAPPSNPMMPEAALHIPNLKVPDIQVLLQDLAQSRRDLFEERRNSGNKIAEERERSRWEQDRLRSDFHSRIKNLETENEAIVRAMGRLQGENDRLREENAVLKHVKANGHEEKTPVIQPDKQQKDVIQSLTQPPVKTMVPLVMQTGPIGSKVSIMGPQ